MTFKVCMNPGTLLFCKRCLWATDGGN